MTTVRSASARETLHDLANALAAARTWLVVLGNSSPREREANLGELLARLNRTIGDAEESCRKLREMLPVAPKRPRRK